MSETASQIPIMNSAAAVTNWFIEKNQTDQILLTHLKIQKLLYYAQGWHLGFFGVPLFEDNIHAWTYGPVVETVYHALKYRGKLETIIEPIPGYVFTHGNFQMENAPKLNLEGDKDRAKYMNSFWGKYSKIEPWVLVGSTHKKGTPWELVASSPSYDRSVNSLIPVQLMKTYFTKLLPEEKRHGRR
jgi:uncharacterized phage-associated protein